MITQVKKLKKDLQDLRKFVEKNFEFVGENFANKVRAGILRQEK